MNKRTHCTPENAHRAPGIIADHTVASHLRAFRAIRPDLWCISTHRTSVWARRPRFRRKPSGCARLWRARGRDARAPTANPPGARPYGGRFFEKPLRAISPSRHQDAQTPPSPRVGEGGRGDEGAKAHGNARAPGAHLRCVRLRRIPRQRRSSPAGASTPSGRASARTLSPSRHQDAQTPPSPRVG